MTAEEIATIARRVPQVPKHWIYIRYTNARHIGCMTLL
jgi:hypothetical protein